MNKLCGCLDYQYCQDLRYFYRLNFFEISKVNEYWDRMLPIRMETTYYPTQLQIHKIELELL